MKVKGSAVAVLPQFIHDEFGEDSYEEWLDNLPEEAEDLYREKVLVSEWYSLEDFFIEPTDVMCDLFYEGNLEGAWELGRYSADYALRGIYKAFIRFATPQKLVSKVSRIFSTYYDPASMRAEMVEDRKIILYIDEFPEINRIVENRIMGWIQRCLELTGAENVKLKTHESLRKGDDYTRITVTWE